MIMNNRRVFYDESMWDRFESKLKTWTYAMMHELLQNQVCSTFLYKILIIIETIQLIYYSIHPVLNSFIFTTDWLDYFRTAVEYFQVNSILNTGGMNLFLIILYLAYSVEVIMLLLLAIITYRIVNNKRKTSTFLNYILKIFSFYALLMNTILAMPFFNVFIATIYCNSDAPYSAGFNCYQEIDFLHISISILGLIFYIMYILLFGVLYIELNPNSSIPFAAPQSKTNMFKQVLKMALPLYVTIDFNGNLCKPFVVVLAMYYLVLLIQRYRTPPIYNLSVHYFVIISEAILFWFAAVDCITAFLDLGGVDNIGFFYAILVIPFISYVYLQLLERRKWNLLITNLKQFKKETDLEMYVNSLIELIETRDRPSSRVKLEGVLKLHVKSCSKSGDQCVCQQLAADPLKDEENPQKQRRWYLLVKSIMSDSLDRFQKCPRLHLQNAYINHEKLKNKFKALFELMITEENKPNVQEEFSIFRYKNLIEEEMIEFDQRNSESKGVDVNIIVTFQNKFVYFLNSIERSVNLHLEFWRELLEENPDIQKLQSLGSKITNTVEQTNDMFRKLNDMNPNHIKCLEIFGNFLREIVNDDQEGQRILEKASYVTKSASMNRQFLDNDRQKYGENSNTCIITCSGNFNNVGIVTNTNNEITRILQFSKSDLIGQNCNRIMPKFYADQHDVFMKNYLETSESKIIGLERLVLAQNKSGYLVACTLMIKVLPNLDEGIQIVGFLKDLDATDEETHYLIFNANTFNILGVTYSCFQRFGIPASLVYGNSTNTNDFTIDSVCPDITDQKNLDELKSIGMATTIDTTTIQLNYLLGHGDSEEELSLDEDNVQNDPSQQQHNPNNSQMYSKQGDMFGNNKTNELTQSVAPPVAINTSQNAEKKKATKYRKARIRAQIIEDSDIGEQRIQILKFVEIDESDEMKQMKTGNELDKVDDNFAGTRQVQTKVDDGNGNNQGEDGNGSDKDSNISGGSINDEMRQLKDFKALISEKTEPKYIKILKRTVWLLMAIMITITGVILGYRIQQNNDVQEGANAIYKSYFRHNVMSDINFNVRLLQLLSVGEYWPRGGQRSSEVEHQIKRNLSYLVDELQQIQFDVIKARITMESRMSSAPVSETYPVEFLLQGGATKKYFNIYNDALFQFITSASSLENSTQASFNITSVVMDTQKNFFYVMYNGLRELRSGSESIAVGFFNFYNKEIQNYQATFIVIMSVAMFFLILSQFVLIPIVFQVHKTNNRVMSLFGIIPIQEIKELAQKCERYTTKFLEDKSERKRGDISEPNIQEGQADQEGQKPDEERGNLYIDNEENGLSPDSSLVLKSPKDNPQSHIIKQQGRQNGPQAQNGKLDHTTPTPGQSKILKKDYSKDHTKSSKKGDEDRNNEENELENLRSQKLLNSKDNNKSIVICQFSLFAAIFISYFIADIVLEEQYLQNINTIYNHLRLISMRPSQIKYAVYFTFEQIVNGQNQMFNGTDLSVYYRTLVYSNERNIFNSIQSTYPAQFSAYDDVFSRFNYMSVCDQQFTINDFIMNRAECQKVDNGLLTKGLRTAIVSVALSTNDLISNYDKQVSSPTFIYGAYQRDVVQSIVNDPQEFDVLQYLIKYIGPSIDYINKKFMDGITSYMNDWGQVEQIKFVIFLVFMFLVFLIFWAPYLNNLSKQIWRTKGMLNMIPMDIIQKYPNLKEAFIGGDILQAVK